MSKFGRKFDEALDRHITGNYGENQFKHTYECIKCGALIDSPKEIDKHVCEELDEPT